MHTGLLLPLTSLTKSETVAIRETCAGIPEHTGTVNVLEEEFCCFLCRVKERETELGEPYEENPCFWYSLVTDRGRIQAPRKPPWMFFSFFKHAGF